MKFYQFLADLVVLIHLTFVLFVVLGGFFAWRRPLLRLLHIAAIVWAVLLELFDWICPLTPLENILRKLSQGQGYETGFIEHYILPLLYPAGLTRAVQITIGAAVLAINLVIYLYMWWCSAMKNENHYDRG